MKRFSVNKARGARSFKRTLARTKVPNIHPRLMRGGVRL